MGVLGTFVGISYGLWNFDSDEVTKSLPPLLAGLKSAFFSSIVGMFLSSSMKIISFFRKSYIEESKTDNYNEKMISLMETLESSNSNIFSLVNRIYEGILVPSLQLKKNHFNAFNERLKYIAELIESDVDYLYKFISVIKNV